MCNLLREAPEMFLAFEEVVGRGLLGAPGIGHMFDG